MISGSPRPLQRPLWSFQSAAAWRAAPKALPARDWSHTVVAHARGRVPDGQSGREGEAGRIWLARLPALPAFRARPATSRWFANMSAPGRVSYEFRNLLLNAPRHLGEPRLPIAPAPANFFPMSRGLRDPAAVVRKPGSGHAAASRAAMDKMTDRAAVRRGSPRSPVSPNARRVSGSRRQERASASPIRRASSGCSTMTKAADRFRDSPTRRPS